MTVCMRGGRVVDTVAAHYCCSSVTAPGSAGVVDVKPRSSVEVLAGGTCGLLTPNRPGT